MSISCALEWAQSKLLATQTLSNFEAKFEAEFLLTELLNVNRAHLIAWPESILSAENKAAYINAVNGRVSGQPIAYILGYREFWGLKLKTTPNTLIPRPDTEILVNETLKKITSETQRIIDLGTGTGAIAIALAKETQGNQNLEIIATDLDSATLATAQHNALEHQASISLIQSDWLKPFSYSSQFDIVVSNPPYIEEDDQHLYKGDLRFEPIRALTSGHDGLTAITTIIKECQDRLKKDGWLLLEHGYAQGENIRSLLNSHGYKSIETIKDYANLDRVTIAQR
ncbi:release factor glutamine methyltransferase [Thiomicrospira sp. ALE5]|nr:release factor glutamine methyltransferase [Thiomicrospira sp. ALE5]